MQWLSCRPRHGQSVIGGSWGRSGRFRTHIFNEGHAVNQFHGEEPVLTVRSQFIQRYQIWMRHIGEGAKLAFETIDVRRFSAGQSLEGDHPVHLAVMGFINDAHAARTQTAVQRKTLSPNKLFSGFYHEGIPRMIKLLDYPRTSSLSYVC